MRLIDAGELKKRTMKVGFPDAPECGEFDAVAVYEIDIMPTIDQESLRTTARWKHGGIDGNSYTVNWICRKCGKVADFDYKYCPNCGARMEGRRDE